MLQETIDEFTEKTATPPHVLICNKKTFKIIALGLRESGVFEEFKKKIPLEMSFSEIPIIKINDAPDDKIYAVDKETYEEIMDIAKPTSSGDKI